MEIVNTQVPITAGRCSRYIRTLAQAFPPFRWETVGKSAYGRPILSLVLGTGPRKVLFTAAHHANEWITALVLLQFAQELGSGWEGGDSQIVRLLEQTTLYTVPMVNPDGVDLVTGALSDREQAQAEGIAVQYPAIAFPDGWKANLQGVDPNLNFPAGWLQARDIKFRQGYTRPAPRDYVGAFPLSIPEARDLARYTDLIQPDLVLALHSQGQEIYWQFKEIVIPGAQALGEQMSAASGYRLADPAPNSSYAGFKDWFILFYRRPGYTVEVGRGRNPLPLDQFPEIYQDCQKILWIAAQNGEIPPKNSE